MPALAGAGFLFLVVGTHLSGLRRRGGWQAVRRARRGEHPTLRWDELLPLEKGWFYGVPIFGTIAVGLALLGTALVLTGNRLP